MLNNNYNPVFKVGEKVIATTTSKTHDKIQKIYLGKTYTVNEVTFCMHCGIQSINVLEKEHCLINAIKCNAGCNKITPLKTSSKFTASKYFIRASEIDAMIEEVLQTENYEAAATLRDIKQQNPTT